MRKIILILIFMFACKLYSQKEKKEIFYFTQTVTDLSIANRFEKSEIANEFTALMELAISNFPKNGPRYEEHLAFSKEACLLHSICFYDMKEYKNSILNLSKKHKELYEIEEKQLSDYLKAHPNIRINRKPNYHKIYQFIDNYIIPCLEKGTKIDFMYTDSIDNMHFFTELELNKWLKANK